MTARQWGEFAGTGLVLAGRLLVFFAAVKYLFLA